MERSSTLFNLGVALFRLSRHTRAVEVFERYLEIGDDDGSRISEARRVLQEARAARSTVVLTVTPDAAQVRVDGDMLPGEGPERELVVDPGRHRITVAAPGHTEQILSLELLPGERKRETAHLVAMGAAPGAGLGPVGMADPGAPRDDEEHESGSLWTNPVFWGVVAVVAIGAGVGIALAAAPQDADPYGGSTNTVLRY
jgi:hypothetical protein